MARLLPHDNDLGWTPYVWLIYIVPFTTTPFYSPRYNTPAGWGMFAAATLALAVLYFRSYWVRGRELLLVAAATVSLGLAFWPISYGAGAMFIFAAGMAGMHERPRIATRGVALIVIVTILEALLLRRDWFAASWPVVFTIMVGAINIHFGQVGRANARLRLAQDEIEHLAKVAERERIARDALSEVRAAVAGYRSGGLESEATHARNALGSAGATVECDLPKTQLPAAHEAVLSLALREAVTNIVRHAGARHVRISLIVNNDACTLTVSDNGRGGNAPFGSGLTGMRERVEVLGGSMTRDGRGGTTLTVTLPLTRAAAERSA